MTVSNALHCEPINPEGDRKFRCSGARLGKSRKLGVVTDQGHPKARAGKLRVFRVHRRLHVGADGFLGTIVIPQQRDPAQAPGGRFPQMQRGQDDPPDARGERASRRLSWPRVIEGPQLPTVQRDYVAL